MGPTWQVLFSALVFVGVLLAVTLLRSSLQARHAAQRAQLRHRVGHMLDDPRLLQARSDTPLGALGAWLGATLDRAGDPRTVPRLLLACMLWGAVATFGTLWLIPGPGGAAGVLFMSLPVLLLRARGRERSEALSRQLPDAMDLIARAMRAGHAFSDALRQSAPELPAPVGDELARVSEQHRLGVEMREALETLLARNPDNFDLRLMTSAVMLQRETGGNLIETLDALGSTMRERQVFQGKVEALTAEVRLSAVILTLLPFFVAGLILLVRPGYLTPLVTTALGRGMLAGGGLSLLIGVGVMRKLSQVEAA